MAGAVRRIATERLEKARGWLDATAVPQWKRVHEARKQAKKYRGLIRLVRPVFPAYSAENAALRDMARRLSDLRDRRALIETYDALLGAFGDTVDRRAFAPLRRSFTLSLPGGSDDAEARERIEAARIELREGLARVPDWTLDAEGWDAIRDGLVKTLGRARDALDVARGDPGEEALHAWRKRVKYHWYHARLLRPVWPKMLDPHVAAASRLSDLLGDRHDLDVFRAALPGPLDDEAAQALEGLALARGEALTDRALDLGARLFAEKPKNLAKRWGAWWRLARS